MYSVWRSLLGLLKLTLGSSVVKNKRFNYFIYTHTHLFALRKSNTLCFSWPPLLPWLTPISVSFHPGVVAFGHSVRCTDSALYFPLPFHVPIMRFPRTIWALCKTYACPLPVALLLFRFKILSLSRVSFEWRWLHWDSWLYHLSRCFGTPNCS